MKTLAQAVLASYAAARIQDAACRGWGSWWAALEDSHEAATTPGQSRAVVARAKQVCGQCPAMAACSTWASIERYTGLAAGSAWQDGHAQPASWVSGQAGRPSRVAS